MLIGIDPGHGGKDPGAVVEGVKEAVINLHVALQLQSIARQAGHETVMSRTTHEGFMELHERAAFFNKEKVDCMVSIHCNAFGDPRAHGFEVFAPTNRDHQLASCIALAKEAAFPARRFRRGDVHPAKKANYAVLNLTTMDAALAELGFLSNPQGRAWLESLDNQLACAHAIFTGIQGWAAVREQKDRANG